MPSFFTAIISGDFLNLFEFSRLSESGKILIWAGLVFSPETGGLVKK